MESLTVDVSDVLDELRRQQDEFRNRTKEFEETIKKLEATNNNLLKYIAKFEVRAATVIDKNTLVESKAYSICKKIPNVYTTRENKDIQVAVVSSATRELAQAAYKDGFVSVVTDKDRLDPYNDSFIISMKVYK